MICVIAHVLGSALELHRIILMSFVRHPRVLKMQLNPVQLGDLGNVGSVVMGCSSAASFGYTTSDEDVTQTARGYQ